MPFFRGNDMDIVTEVLTDANGDAILVGTVNAQIFTTDGATSLIANAAMTHSAAGVWKRRLQAEDMDGIAAGIAALLTRVTVGDPVDATFERTDQLTARD